MLFVLFRAKDKKYGLDSNIIEEVIPSIPLEIIPEAPSHIVGRFIYRRRMLHVLDFNQLIEKRPAKNYLSTRIIVLKESSGHKSIGLRAEGVVAFEEIPFEQVTVCRSDELKNSFCFGQATISSGEVIGCVNVTRLFDEATNVDEKFFSLNYSS